MPHLTDELLRFDKDAAAELSTVHERREAILRAAREDALSLAQTWDKRKGSERDAALATAEKRLAKLKEATITKARADAAALKTRAKAQEPAARAAIVAALIKEAAA